eukprot:TRINITY_DN1095_c0_g1_i4.p1 TRINITY_DN1095_c0_g1~~TRINITY_DN1095_c0_g1_i4.p1  ORF type:complete len:232 (+),score=38.80 TRINITY_DN1095_c0_g1_i4:135-830(+)
MAAELRAPLPDDLLHAEGLTVINGARFDPTRMGNGLELEDRHRVISNPASTSHKMCYLDVPPVKTGKMLVHVKVIHGGENNYNSFGMGPFSSARGDRASFPGYRIPGASLYGNNGAVYSSGGTAASYTMCGALPTGTVVGILINMEHRTLTFFVNGRNIGMAADASVLTADAYYFVMSLHDPGAKLAIMDTVVPATADGITVLDMSPKQRTSQAQQQQQQDPQHASQAALY